jgi:hypothetical protein
MDLLLQELTGALKYIHQFKRAMFGAHGLLSSDQGFN